MKLPSVFSCAVLILMLLASSSATASALQSQAVREQELSAALRAGNGFGDSILMNGFQDHNYNPARDGFINNPARGGFMLNAPIRR